MLQPRALIAADAAALTSAIAEVSAVGYSLVSS